MLFVGDHHATDEPYLQNVPLLARCLAEWGDRPYGALFQVPLWHPVLLAELVGSLAVLSPGRFVLIATLGTGDEQFAALDVDRRRRVELLVGNLDRLRSILAGGDPTVSPLPPEPVDIWVGAYATAAIERAAAIGDAFLVGPGLPLDAAVRHRQLHLDRCERLGRMPVCHPIRRNVHVVADAMEGRRLLDAEQALADPACIVGTIDEVAEAFGVLASRGFTDVVVRHVAYDQAAVLDSYERLAEVRRLVG